MTAATGDLQLPAAAARPDVPVNPTASATPENGSIPMQTLSSEAVAPTNGEIYRGTGSFVGRATRAPTPATGKPDDGTTLNFVNADIADVAKTVLGDYLKVNYVIDAAVQGGITLQTSRPLQRDEVLPALEQSLRLAGLAIVQTGDLYRVVPVADATRQSGVVQLGAPAARTPGFGIEIVPLRFIGAAEMQHLLESVAPSGAILRVDPARNLLLIAGSSQERAAILDNVSLFDADWMSGMSFALLPLKSADAKSIVAELNQVTGGKDGPLGGLVRLTPIERMNAVLAISPQPKYLDELRSWVSRLDRAQETSEKRIYVYYVQNGRASDLANALTKVLYGTSSSTDDKSSSSLGATAPGEVPQQLLGQLATPAGGSTPQLPAFTDRSKVGGGPEAADTGTASASGDTSGDASNRMHITADERNNALLILARPHEYEQIEAALTKLDVPPLQVMLEAAVAEVTLTNELRYGIQYFFKSGSSHQITNTTTSNGSISASFPGFAYSFTSGPDIKVVLNALEDVTRVDVLSSPQILVLNNQTASLQVGDQVPIATQESVSTTTSDAPIVNSIQYHDTGVILKVTPHVNESGLVQLDVSQEVSDVGTTTSSSLNSPTIQQRKINSTVAVQDGETVALGGLIKDSRNRERTGIPVLQDIPYLGNLFGATNTNGTRTELLVMITPHVIQGVQKLRNVTDELRRKLGATAPLLPTVR
ncbi:type II secretion system protein GspD [Aliidongia dinghuensis]|uniref:Type II secretion system protein GspD n=1 Tax=Aliidongia dinghuensis TaxID=1867774 RepID=A0A8J3E7D1_9PROT|nr:type II secretion system protein GspD [Aliidongia dinghuensis]